MQRISFLIGSKRYDPRRFSAATVPTSAVHACCIYTSMYMYTIYNIGINIYVLCKIDYLYHFQRTFIIHFNFLTLCTPRITIKCSAPFHKNNKTHEKTLCSEKVQLSLWQFYCLLFYTQLNSVDTVDESIVAKDNDNANDMMVWYADSTTS